MICRLDALATAARAISAGILPRSTRQESSRCTCWRMTRSSVSSFVCLSETRTVPKAALRDLRKRGRLYAEGGMLPAAKCIPVVQALQKIRDRKLAVIGEGKASGCGGVKGGHHGRRRPAGSSPASPGESPTAPFGSRSILSAWRCSAAGRRPAVWGSRCPADSSTGRCAHR